MIVRSKEDTIKVDAQISGVLYIFGELGNIAESADGAFSVGCGTFEALWDWGGEVWYVVGFWGLELRATMWAGRRLWADDVATTVLKPSFPSIDFSQPWWSQLPP